MLHQGSHQNTLDNLIHTKGKIFHTSQSTDHGLFIVQLDSLKVHALKVHASIAKLFLIANAPTDGLLVTIPLSFLHLPTNSNLSLSH